MSAKAKRVLPTRPEPPSAEQILEDVQGTDPSDPVFVLPAEPPPEPGPAAGEPSLGTKGGPAAEERERLYRQIRSYVGMNQRLQRSREQLRERRRELQRVGDALERGIAEMRQKAF
ncbi:CS025 protein, partial [Drymodes brunneopygia]|nr:CS025 protein [Drymodes brunneopygia]